MTASYIGQPQNRVDGRAKVTGEAKFAAEVNVPNLLYGYVFSSAIAKGKITKIDAERALELEGVVQVFTHENRPRTTWFDSSPKDGSAPPGTPFRPLYDDKVVYSGQPVGLVLGESFEAARCGAALVRVEYQQEAHETDLNNKRDVAREPKKGRFSSGPPKPRGDPENAFANSVAHHEAEYVQPFEHHNPMEMHASTVIYETGGSLTVYEKTQGVRNTHKYICTGFGLAEDEVRVLSPFVGGAFGSGLRPQYQLFLAVMAALQLKRSVRVSLTRHQMFSFGHRPCTIQRVSLGASADGALDAIIHSAIAETSQFEDYSENVVGWSGLLYQCANVKLAHSVAPLDVYTPSDMRAPGATTGIWALESAMDELAYTLNIDPLELRLKNYAERDQIEDKPFSSKALRECYRQGAEQFGWSRRNPEPRSTREGDHLVGWGMATGVWEALYAPMGAKAVISADGRLEISSATCDIGTGTYTILSQIAAETLGLPIENVTCKLGDSSSPFAMSEGGSMTAASVGCAVMEVCRTIREKLFKLAQQARNLPFADARPEDVTFSEAHIKLKHDPSKAVSLRDIMRAAKVNAIEEETTSKLRFAAELVKQRAYARNTHSAIFAEVKIDEALGTIHVTRVVSAIAGGRILNPKTARNQIMGSVVWGIGMALHEESVMDHRYGRFVNRNLGEYHIPVNADVHDIEVIFVEEHDQIVNPLGVKGLGEIGLVGVAPAIANAVFHATGKRIRTLPITLDKLM